MRASVVAIAILGMAHQADAFCGFYVGGAGAQMFNNATEVVLMRHGTTTVLSMENNYQGPPDKFALVVPVPVVVHEGQVKTLPRALFEKIDVLGAPRLVEYWEQDPCNSDDDDEADYAKPSKKRKYAAKDSDDDASDHDYHVKIEAKFSVAEYNIVVLSAQESTGLERWLHANHYEIPAGAAPLLRPYIEQGMKFFVAKVDPKKVTFANGMTTLSPLRFHYDSPEFSLPIRLGVANSSGTQDLIVNILAPDTRYEVANHPNVTIPTNLEVKDAVRGHFGEFYAALFDHTLERVPNAVVTEYSWDSGSCDPCPGPTLDPGDIATLGGDVISTTYQTDEDSGSYTLTRLHARYGKDVQSDLVFRAVQPIAGGRGIPDAHGGLPTAIEHDDTNNFQGRYVILHPWAGAMSCPTPHRGEWGGPPRGRAIATQAATNLAFAPRGKSQLATFVAAVPEIGMLDSTATQLPIPVRLAPAPSPQGCGCQAEGAANGLPLILVLLLRRRRK